MVLIIKLLSSASLRCTKRLPLASPWYSSAIRFRLLATQTSEKGLTESQEKTEVSTDVRTVGEKVKEATKTVSYTGVILVGVGITGVIFYYVFRELFSGNSANSVYTKALDLCKNDPRIEDALGAPIKGFGEETSRRRRSHISHAIYERDGVPAMRMRFYIKGIRNKATVEADLKQEDNGNYEFRYILAQLDDYTKRVIIVEDNRKELDKKTNDSSSFMPIMELSK